MFKGELPRIEIKIGKKVYEIDVKDEIEIGDDLPGELLTQASKFAWVATLCELSRKQEDLLKMQRDITEAEVAKRIRESLVVSGDKVVESKIVQLVKLSEESQVAMKRLIDAREKVGVLASLKEAFQQRCFMLQSIAANRRAEMNATVNRVQ